MLVPLLAKEIEDVSYTACGSPMYMAPEFLKSKGEFMFYERVLLIHLF